MDSEKKIEKNLTVAVELMGGWCRKLKWLAFTGAPDRVILLPGGRLFFVELKSEGKKPSKRQTYVHTWLRSAGFNVEVIDSQLDLTLFIKKIQNA